MKIYIYGTFQYFLEKQNWKRFELEDIKPISLSFKTPAPPDVKNKSQTDLTVNNYIGLLFTHYL